MDLSSNLNKIVLCTGVSGCGRVDYIEKVKKYSKEKERGKDFQIFDVGDMILKTSSELGRPIDDAEMIDAYPLVEDLRAVVFERIVHETQKTKVSIIACHACMRRKKHLESCFHFSYLERLKPSFYITIINNITYIKENLERDKKWRGMVSVEEIITWQDEEQFITKMLAQYQKKPFYIISYNDTPKTLYDLISNTNMKKLYLSFPITHIKEKMPEKLKEVEQFRERLRENFIVFDPLTITDLLDTSEWSNDILEMLKGQTVGRDYRFIDQSDFIVVYYPVIERSAGVFAEMKYALQTGKPIYAYIVEESPFIREFCTYPCSSLKELKDKLSDRYSVRWQE